jgi:hypothetical protein
MSIISNLWQRVQLKVRGYIVIDNFFSKQITSELRSLALSEKDVNQYYTDGYKAADYDNDSVKMSLKVVDFVQKKVNILKDKKYQRSWSFLYNTICRGVNIHADPSTFNVNVWVTPNYCVEDRNKNGLILFKKMASSSMTWKQYNGDDFVINEYLKGAKYVRIPYKFNRAVIFPGKTFHTTDFVHMKPGHNNKRINYTFLFD